MTSPYVANTPKDREQMMRSIGIDSIADLFKGIPKGLRFDKKLNLPGPLSEFEIRSEIDNLTDNNSANFRRKCFLGAGLYDHYSPAIVNQLTLRGEYLTAYTPYQPEVSQGTLQVLFEFQTMVASLFGMDISNASHYDGAAALADGVLMAKRVQKKANICAMSQGLHPDYAASVKCYVPANECEFVTIPLDPKSGAIDSQALGELATNSQDGELIVVIQQPNYFGCIEDLENIAKITKSKGHLLVTATAEPLSLALMEPPGRYGTDIAVGEGQSFGLPPSFGGPLLGLFTTRKEYIRQLPGRVCGLTKDAQGEPCFTLTLNTREQHIRRKKATSNICTNENLCVVMASIYLSLLGRQGIRQLASQNLSLSEYLKSKAINIKGVKQAYSNPTFNEFVIRLPEDASEVCAKSLADDGLVLGLPLSKTGHANDLLVTVTETKARGDLDGWLASLQNTLKN